MDTQNQPSDKSAFSQVIQSGKAYYAAFKTKYPRAFKGLKISGGLFLAGIAFIFLLWFLVYAGAFGKLPSTTDLKNIHNHTASEIYSVDSVLLGKYYIENRINVDNEEISPHLINALIATEDARFFKHSGIDLRSWVRVFFKTVLLQDQSSGGGSTLSQQLAKNLFPRKRYKLLSIPIIKIKEMIVAKRLERNYSKEELINLYLNTVPFGSNMFGVEVAAQQLFNTSAKELKIQDAAVLVGMLKANTTYNPVRNPERSLARRNTVLRQMNKYEYISQEVFDSLQTLPLETYYQRESNHLGLATYLREHLRLELDDLIRDYRKPDGSPYNIYTDGLKIYTTIHSRMQQYAEESVAEHMEKLQDSFDKHWKGRKPWGNDKILRKQIENSQRYIHLKAKGLSEAEIDKIFETPVKMTVFSWKKDEVIEMSPLDSIKYYYGLLNAGFLAMEPSSGAIRAWVGGIDHKYFQYDHVKSKRQVGSTFKPIVYAAALQRGIEPCEYRHNRLVTYTEYDDWQPQNADGQYGGVYSMQGALTKSVNSIAVDLIMNTGVDSVALLAQQMGITGDIPKVPAIALGAVDASLYDMIKVYGTLANRGVRPEPYYLSHIETAKGERLATFAPSSKNDKNRVLTKDQADIMVEIMQAVVDSGTARRLRYQYHLANDIAGKTGTTQSHTDGWFLGFTPKLVAGAWVGGESPKTRFRSLKLGQGANTALPIWGRFMNKVYKDADFKPWKKAVFPTPSVFTLERLDCPPYLEEMPMIAEEWDLEHEGGVNEAIDNLLEAFRKDKKRVNTSPDGPRKETDVQRRIRKQNEELREKREREKRKKEKKENRKKFWDRLLNKK